MEILKNQNFTFVFLLILYFLPYFLGNIIVKSNHKIKIKGISLLEQKIADPLTLKIYKIIRKINKKNLDNRNYFYYMFLLLFEKIFLEILIIRVFYGIIFTVPIFINIWNGFSKGVLYHKKDLNFLYLLEDISYIMASMVGINFGINLFEHLFTAKKLIFDINLSYLVYSIIFIIFLTNINFYFSFFGKKD